MVDVNSTTLDKLKEWLACRRAPNSEDKAVISAPDNLRSIGFADLVLEKATARHQETVKNCYDFNTQKPKPWTELYHLMNWSFEFIEVLKSNKNGLATLELLRGANEFPISIAKFHVDESVSVVECALDLEVCLDMQHPDTRGQNYAVNNILIEESTCLQDIVRQVFACLYSKCVVRLVVRTNNFYSAVMTAYLVDLMYASGAKSSEIKCVAFDRRESIGNERFAKPLPANKLSKLSTIATVFKQTDTFAAAQAIIDSYFREQYPNMIVLVEESVYERFVQDWQRYYSHAMHIGARLDDRSNVVDSFNSKVQIHLDAIDIKTSHKMSGYVINVLKFRTLTELMSLLTNLRKVPYMSIWNDDILLSREFCLRLNLCSEFWINHMPRSVAGRRLPEDMLSYYYDTVAEDMTHIYNSVYSQYTDETEQLRKLHATFMKKDNRLKSALVMQAFVSIVSKTKSLKNGSTVGEAVARLKRFQKASLHRLSELDGNESLVETLFKPVGLAILLVREESSLKNKSVLLEFVFKNLLLGNAVLLVCPQNTFGVKFVFDNDHVIPFKMVHEELPDISRLSLDATIEHNETSINKKQCPKNTYAIEFLSDMTSETCDCITISLGSRRKSIWCSNTEQANYWSNE